MLECLNGDFEFLFISGFLDFAGNPRWMIFDFVWNDNVESAN